MDPVFGVMLDVARIVTFQPHGVGSDTRRAEPVREPTTDAQPPISQRQTSRMSQFMFAVVGLGQMNSR